MDADVFDAPVFARSDVVFFPHTLLNVHAKETQWGKIEEGSLFAVALTRPGAIARAEAHGNTAPPEVFKTVGLGKVLRRERRQDRTWDLKLEGTSRASIVEKPKGGVFFRAKMVKLKEQNAVENAAELAESRRRLTEEISAATKRMPHFSDLIARILTASPRPGVLADLLAAHFVVDLYDRQSILSELDVIRRVDLMAVQFEMLNRRLRQQERKAS